MANWLDKYEQGGLVLKKKTKDNYGKKENANAGYSTAGPGWVGEGTTNRGFNYNGAWGGTMQNGGKLTLPEAIVYGHKDPNTKTYFNKVRGIAENYQDKNFWLTPLAGYHALEQMYSKYGAPKINTIGEDDRPHYNPFINTINIPEPTKDNGGNWSSDVFLDELAHKVQSNKKGNTGFIKDHVGKDLLNTLKNIDSSRIFTKNGWLDAYRKNYFTPGTQEYEAHSVIQPKLQTEYREIREKQFDRLYGDMAMGGTMPGATGMMYARTQDPAPSNGPYAKKTKASAQNGTEMKYYQEGLDFKPKTISKNGSVIKDDLGQWAHPGEITQIGSNEITMKGVDYPVIGISDTGDTKVMYPGKDYKFDGNMVTEYPLAQDGENITKKLKKEAEEKLERMKKPKATVSQYTPKKGEAERLDREKLQRIEESYQPLNRFASSKAAKNLQDAALFATDAMVLGEGALATKGLLKNAYTNIIDDAVKAGSNAVKGLDLTKSQQGPKLISSFDELYKQRLAEELSKRHGSLKIDPTTGESYKVVSPKLYKEASRNYEAWYEGADRTLNKAANLQTSRYSHNFFNSSLEPIENKELLKGVRANYRKNKNGGWLNKYK